MNEVLFGVWDVHEEAGDKLHGVENLRSVSVGFFPVENLLGVRFVAEALEADGRAQHVEGESLETPRHWNRLWWNYEQRNRCFSKTRADVCARR